MAFLFNHKPKPRNPSEMLRTARELMLQLDGASHPKVRPKTRVAEVQNETDWRGGNLQIEEELTHILHQLRQMINGLAGSSSGRSAEWTPVLARYGGLTGVSYTDIELTDTSNCDMISTAVTGEIPLLMAKTLARLPFETRKDAVVVLSHILRYRPPNTDPQTEPWALHHILYQAPESIIALVHGYKETRIDDIDGGHFRPGEAVTPSCGLVLREVIRQEAACSAILHDEPDADWIYGPAQRRGVQHINRKQVQSGKGVFWTFFEWIDGTGASFELSTDAFATFKVSLPLLAVRYSLRARYADRDLLPLSPHQELLTRHKDLVARYLQVNYSLFFTKYNTLLTSPNYVTKRQAIKLLGEILLDRDNYRVMTRYVEDADNLKRTMLLLREPRRMVAYEGFHVFKIFAASPTKSPAVLAILVKNRARLLDFLPSFLDDRTDDDQFTDEKAYLLRIIKALPESLPASGAEGLVSPTSPMAAGQWQNGIGSANLAS